jgi:hypothetical protein
VAEDALAGRRGSVVRRLRAAKRALASPLTRASGREVDEDVTNEEIERSPFAYPYLNALHEQIMRKGGRALRANYLFGVLHAAHLARMLDIPSITAIEFGVAGGNGLLALEKAAAFTRDALGVSIEVYGFDTGRGLPKPEDVRDCPNLFLEGQFPLDEQRLLNRLDDARLVLGPVEETLGGFVGQKPSPVGFIAFDLDLYSSTAAALRLLEVPVDLLLPRIYSYFDDITGFTYADHNGARLAINEFNETHSMRKVSPVYAAEFYVPRREASALWTRKLYLAHVLDHPRYGDYDGLLKPEKAGAGGAWAID